MKIRSLRFSVLDRKTKCHDQKFVCVNEYLTEIEVQTEMSYAIGTEMSFLSNNILPTSNQNCSFIIGTQ